MLAKVRDYTVRVTVRVPQSLYGDWNGEGSKRDFQHTSRPGMLSSLPTRWRRDSEKLAHHTGASRSREIHKLRQASKNTC